jgi:hydroxymethylbilane synthase
MKIRLGTRGSALARWQADWVAGELLRRGVEVELVPISTTGDRQQGPIGALGGTGLFTKEIQRALVDARIDLAVHSLKDLPTEEVPGLCLAAVPQRAPVWDVLVSRDGLTFDQLPRGATLGTSSLRRQSQLRQARPDLQPQEIRGNVDTRLRKLHEGQYEALVLAQAGLTRLGLQAHITQVFAAATLLPAVGQGALGLETRSDDRSTRQAVEQLNDAESYQGVIAERAMLAALRGGCLAPIAAWGRIESGRLVLTGRVLSADGAEKREITLDGPPDTAAALGQTVAQRLLEQGAGQLIAAARG